jgi:preprotein translocase SecA subunit
MGVLDRFLRVGEGKKVKALQSLVPDISALEPELERLSDEQLQAKTGEFRQRLDQGASLDDLLIDAFAVVREGGKRVLGQRHFDVQLMGGAALHFGWIAEMKTGEGKTLVSTLPAYLNGLSGRGMHLVTVNDYLATRDAQWMGRLHRWLGLSVGLIVPGDTDPDYKLSQYAADITYGTNNEFGFDYLRDNMAPSRARQVQRGHVYAIVDEVDSILVDEARTPLIISGRVADAAQLYYKFASIVRGLKAEAHYEVDEEKRTVSPTEEGIERVERELGIENLYDGVAQNLVHQLQAALRAKELFKRDKDYVVVSGEVKIVDEFTGRILEGRRWSEGLHQAVEAKEGVRIKEENQTLATVTLQNYFRMYEKLAGMTGTAQSDAAELAATYELQVVPIPTNEPVIRADQGDLIYKSEEAKFESVAGDIAERYEAGQPVLVGTISVEKSERLSRLLDKQGIPHQVLNAKPDRAFREAEIVAQAGRLHAVTVATNMAGRGVDIILGGNPEGLAKRDMRAEELDPDTEENRPRLDELIAQHEAETKPEGDKVRELGGLYVLGTERHDSRRIDNQLRGRSGRQGDPGESRFYLSLEDDLMRLFATGAVNWVMGADHGRAAQRRDPQERPQVRRGHERAAQGDLRHARPGARPVRPARQAGRRGPAGRRQHAGRGPLRQRVRRGVGPRGAASRGAHVLAVDALGRAAAAGVLHQRALRDADGRGAVPLRATGGRAHPGRHAPGRASGDAAGDRPALAGPPPRDGLPARGHQPAGHGSEGPAGRVAARRLRHVRPDDAWHLAGLHPLRDARAGAGQPAGGGLPDRRRSAQRTGDRGCRQRRCGCRGAGPAVLVAGRSVQHRRGRQHRGRRSGAAGVGRICRRAAASRRWRQRAAGRRAAGCGPSEHADGEVRVGQDAAQRPLPVRIGQEIQAVPRPVTLHPVRVVASYGFRDCR